MSSPITFTAQDGSEVTGEIALPVGDDKAPGLVLVQEWWGVNDHIRSLADRFAAAGFLTIAPDLYHGKVTSDGAEAQAMMIALDGKRALADIAAATQALIAHPRCSGKIGVTGFCMGGAYAFVAATRIPEIAAAVPFYGLPPAGRADFTKARPIMAHFATKDQWATVAGAEAIKKEVEASGGLMTLHVYDADHAFMRDTDAAIYSPKDAKIAWDRTITFLHQQLG
ncbi:MAG: dienelactone hydrolase family protein [Byssovorax sp.]